MRNLTAFEEDHPIRRTASKVHLVGDDDAIRRMFYEAESKLEAYENDYAEALQPESKYYRTLKERFFGYSEVLSSDDVLSFDLH